jgi:uncharacterized protein YhfF
VAQLPAVAEVVGQLKAAGVVLPPGNVTVDGYGDSAALSHALIELIRSGKKRAGTGLLWAYQHDNQPIAQVGDLEVVVSFDLKPALVTRIKNVTVVPFNQVSAAYAAVEGEGDGSLEYWQSGHWEYFSRECARIGRAPDPTMPVICCEFEVIATVSDGAA